MQSYGRPSRSLEQESPRHYPGSACSGGPSWEAVTRVTEQTVQSASGDEAETHTGEAPQRGAQNDTLTQNTPQMPLRALACVVTWRMTSTIQQQPTLAPSRTGFARPPKAPPPARRDRPALRMAPVVHAKCRAAQAHRRARLVSSSRGEALPGGEGIAGKSRSFAMCWQACT